MTLAPDESRPRMIRGVRDEAVAGARGVVGGDNWSETVRLAVEFAAAVAARAQEARRAFGIPNAARAVEVALDLALARTTGATTPEATLRTILRLAQVALGDVEPARAEPPPPAANLPPQLIEGAAGETEIWASAVYLRRDLRVPLRFIGRYLASRGVRPPRGGDWHNQQVKLGLVKAGYDWDANEPGEE